MTSQPVPPRLRLSGPAPAAGVLAQLSAPFALLLALLCSITVSAVPAASAAPQSGLKDLATVAAVDRAKLVVQVNSVTPGVVTDSNAETEITITGRVTNNGTAPAQQANVSIALGSVLTERAQVSAWANSRTPAKGAAVATTTLSTPIDVGKSESFSLSFPASKLPAVSNFGSVGLSVQTNSDAQRTFVGVQRRKQYEPLRVVWGQPVTLPALPQLSELAPSDERDSAWEAVLGAKQASHNLLANVDGLGEQIAPVLDGSLLATDTASTSDEKSVRASFAAELKDQLTRSGGLVLPGGDPDFAAILSGAPNGSRDPITDVPAIREEAAATRNLVDPLTGGNPVLMDVAWNTDSTLSPNRVSGIGSIVGAPTTILTSQDALPGMPTAARHTTDGVTVISNDSDLAAAVTNVSPNEEALARQRIIADSALIVREYPGVQRTIFAVPERSSATTGATYNKVVDSLTDIPWLSVGTMKDLRTAITADASQAPVIFTDRKTEGERTGSVTPDAAAAVNSDTAAAQSFAAIRTDGPAFVRQFHESASAALSTRWRGQVSAGRRALTELNSASAPGQGAIKISTSDVNFFAETGRLQVTINNTLPVDLQNLVLRFNPGSPGLRVDAQPGPVTVAAESRQTITAPTTALAAGTVPVRISVTTPQGQSVAIPADLTVRAQPTGSWIYPVLAGTVVLLFVAGVLRSRRRPRRPRHRGTNTDSALPTDATAATEDPA